MTYKDATHQKGVECNEAKVLNRNTIGVGTLDKTYAIIGFVIPKLIFLCLLHLFVNIFHHNCPDGRFLIIFFFDLGKVKRLISQGKVKPFISRGESFCR